MVPPKTPKVEPSLDDSLIITTLLLLTDLDTFSQTAGMLIPPNYITLPPFPFMRHRLQTTISLPFHGSFFLGNCSSWISMIHGATSNIMDFVEKYPGLPFTKTTCRTARFRCRFKLQAHHVSRPQEAQQNLPDIFVCMQKKQRAICIGLKTLVISYRLYQNLLESLIFKKQFGSGGFSL